MERGTAGRRGVEAPWGLLERHMKTFVVRVWVATGPIVEAGGEALHGVVEHVGSGRSTPFGNANELLAFLREAEPAEPAPAEPTRVKGGEP